MAVIVRFWLVPAVCVADPVMTSLVAALEATLSRPSCWREVRDVDVCGIRLVSPGTRGLLDVVEEQRARRPRPVRGDPEAGGRRTDEPPSARRIDLVGRLVVHARVGPGVDLDVEEAVGAGRERAAAGRAEELDRAARRGRLRRPVVVTDLERPPVRRDRAVSFQSAPPVPAVPTVTVPEESWNVPAPAKPLFVGDVTLPPETVRVPPLSAMSAEPAELLTVPPLTVMVPALTVSTSVMVVTPALIEVVPLVVRSRTSSVPALDSEPPLRTTMLSVGTPASVGAMWRVPELPTLTLPPLLTVSVFAARYVPPETPRAPVIDCAPLTESVPEV